MPTDIEWTDETWNPVSGCRKVSPGCKHCYAERVAARFWKGRKFTDVQTHHDRLYIPIRWKKPRMVFVNSMSDLFEESVPFEFIDEVFAIILGCHVLDNVGDHTFQILTKRPERMLRYFTEVTPVELLKRWANAGDVHIHMNDEDVFFSEYVFGKTCMDWQNDGYAKPGCEWKPWGYIDKLWPLPNVWLGVSTEDQPTANLRVPILLQVPAAIRFVSGEPLLSDINYRALTIGDRISLDALTGCHTGHSGPGTVDHCLQTLPKLPSKLPPLDWVIVGGESGHDARPMHPDWARCLRDQCQAAGTAFFFKQHGEYSAIYDRDVDDPDWRRCGDYERKHPKGRWLNLAGGHGFHGERVCYVDRVGKKAAGRLLDGVEWNEFPKATT